jgi:hypothetical protein
MKTTDIKWVPGTSSYKILITAFKTVVHDLETNHKSYRKELKDIKIILHIQVYCTQNTA